MKLKPNKKLPGWCMSRFLSKQGKKNIKRNQKTTFLIKSSLPGVWYRSLCVVLSLACAIRCSGHWSESPAAWRRSRSRSRWNGTAVAAAMAAKSWGCCGRTKPQCGLSWFNRLIPIIWGKIYRFNTAWISVSQSLDPGGLMLYIDKEKTTCLAACARII